MVVVSPFVDGEAFSGPAVKLMKAVDAEPGTPGLSRVYPFADAVVVDDDDSTTFEIPTVRTDISIGGRDDAARVIEAVTDALAEVR